MREYRVLLRDPSRPFPREVFSAREDDAIWKDWVGEPKADDGEGPPIDTTHLSGVLGLAEATVLENTVWKPKAVCWIEEREVTDWHRVGERRSALRRLLDSLGLRRTHYQEPQHPARELKP